MARPARSRASSTWRYRYHSYFWSEKADAFAAAADAVWAETRPAAGAATYIADYVWRGLERRGRAIEILFEALAGDRLAEAQIHEAKWQDARATLDAMLTKDWPERFRDTHQKAQQLKGRLPPP